MGLIDKDRLVAELQMAYAEPICSIEEAIDIALTTINEQPTVDADSLNAAHEDIGYEKGYRDGYSEALDAMDNIEPIKHGHWNERYDTQYHFECSICKYLHQYKDNYCPLCGAKMDEEVKRG